MTQDVPRVDTMSSSCAQAISTRVVPRFVIAVMCLHQFGAAADIDVERQVRPLLVERCGDCHGFDTQESSLRLDVRHRSLEGGDVSPVIPPGKAAESVIETVEGRPPVADFFTAESHADLVAGEPGGRAFLAAVNARHLAARSDHSELAARIAAYELAARPQFSMPEVTNLLGESDVFENLDRLDHPEIGPFGRQCLLARRLVERGVRFVQISCGIDHTKLSVSNNGILRRLTDVQVHVIHASVS